MGGEAGFDRRSSREKYELLVGKHPDSSRVSERVLR
jgi:hypothetical protein